MYNTFNMGVGFAGVVNENDANEVVGFLKQKGEEVFIIGKVVTAGGKNKIFFEK